MLESHILLLLIIVTLVAITIHSFFNSYTEKLTDNKINIYNNNRSYNDETNLLVPTKNMEYNPYDIHRPANELPIQEQDNEIDTDKLSTVVNTTGDTPIVYSHDELTHTIYHNPPSIIQAEIDAGSGNINTDVEIHTNKLDNLQGIS